MKKIIEKFNQNDEVFYEDVVLGSRKNKGKINEVLLEHLKDISKNLDKYESDSIPISVLYSIFLLAEFQNKNLFPILIEIFNKEDYDYYDIMGDGLINRLSNIIVSVFDGDFTSINKIIENKKINDCVREEFLYTYIYFYKNNLITKEELEKYLNKLINLYYDEDDNILSAICEIVATTHLFSMIKKIKHLFNEGLIDYMYMGNYSDFIDTIFNYEKEFRKVYKIEDVVEEMAWWDCFKNNSDFKRRKINKLNNSMNKGINKIQKDTTSKPNRNDPCPCGSGKKYKKCCIDKEVLTLPYQQYIDESLSGYPKKKDDPKKHDLYDFYKSEYIELDKLLYKAIKPINIPYHINRNYRLENKIRHQYLNEALKKIKKIVETNKFKTVEEFDDEVGIHYSLSDFLREYSEFLESRLDEPFCNEKEVYLKNLDELINFFYNNFDNLNERILLKKKTNYYILTCDYSEGIKFLNKKLDSIDPIFKYDIYENLFELYSYEEDDVDRMDEVIKKEKDTKLKKELEKLKKYYLDRL